MLVNSLFHPIVDCPADHGVYAVKVLLFAAKKRRTANSLSEEDQKAGEEISRTIPRPGAGVEGAGGASRGHGEGNESGC